jgi:hypothetical protein
MDDQNILVALVRVHSRVSSPIYRLYNRLILKMRNLEKYQPHSKRHDYQYDSWVIVWTATLLKNICTKPDDTDFCYLKEC